MIMPTSLDLLFSVAPKLASRKGIAQKSAFSEEADFPPREAMTLQAGRAFQGPLKQDHWLRPRPGRDAGSTLRPPDRSERALLTHSAPTLGV